MTQLPSYLAPEDSFAYDLSLMQESLRRRGVDPLPESPEDILASLHSLNVSENLRISHRPPLPCDYVDVAERFPGHGFWYKSGKGSLELHKDNGFEDYDCFDNFVRLTNCRVLLADHALIREEFNLSADLSNEDLNRWLIDQFCFVSTGQIKRMKEGGDLHDMVEPGWVSMVDETSTKLGLRQRGGGRANTFFVNDEFDWSEDGRMTGQMMDCKGTGVTDLQKSFEKKASGFLSYADALKGFVYENGLRYAVQHGPEGTNWDTVHCYAIIDIGIRWSSYNPATGIEGDVRNVILLRAPHSRYCGGADHPVYYSVVQSDELERDEGQRLISACRSTGISSEQIPLSSEAGTWNVQCTAAFDTLVDFSHWYFMPGFRDDFLPAFRMSEETFVLALRLFGKFTIRCPEARRLAWGTDDEEEAMEMLGEAKEELDQRAEGLGVVGWKPKLSWSWFCELDDSEVQRTLLRLSCAEEEEVEDLLSMEQIKEWLVGD